MNVLSPGSNDGTLTAVGPLVVNTDDFTGFDISGLTGTAYAAFQEQPSPPFFSSFYPINLSTGAATLVGQIGTGAEFTVLSVAAMPGAIPETLLLLGTGLAGVMRVRRRRRAHTG